MNIVTFGSLRPGSTVAHRARALQSLGHQVSALNSDDFIGRHGRISSWLHYRTGYRLLQRRLYKRLHDYFSSLACKPDLLWIDSGQYVGPTVLRRLRLLIGCPIILYCNDDPTGPRDWLRFASLREAFPYYDLCVYRREINELEWLALGARKVLRVWMSYDEVVHQSLSLLDNPVPELLFIGTNISTERRGAFLASLVRSHIPLSIYGSRWQRSAHWPVLRSFISGSSLVDNGYAHRLSLSALSLGMLSTHNRDLHTRRSVEVPASGGALIAERTSEHKLLFEESVEALFWDNVNECISLCKSYLSDPAAISKIRHAGHARTISLGVGNQDICKQVLSFFSS
jgi:spore maturation protein CgeB